MILYPHFLYVAYISDKEILSIYRYSLGITYIWYLCFGAHGTYFLTHVFNLWPSSELGKISPALSFSELSFEKLKTILCSFLISGFYMLCIPLLHMLIKCSADFFFNCFILQYCSLLFWLHALLSVYMISYSRFQFSHSFDISQIFRWLEYYRFLYMVEWW